MIRLHILAEGQTEETFVNTVLVEHLSVRAIYPDCRCVETSRDRRRHRIYRGGLLRYTKARADLIRWMKEDQNAEAWFTTMFDLYALPDDFPGFAEARSIADPARRIAAVEDSFAKDVNHPRFVPYLQLHEFEALLLADPTQFDWEFIEHSEAIRRLVALAQSIAPEMIDDGQESAPSK